MAKAIPLIRGAAIIPFLRWMLAHGRPIEAPLRATGLSPTLLDDPMRPISLANGLAFLGEIGAREAPDLGCRVVSQASVVDVTVVARALAGARTPRETLSRAVLGLPMHCSHEGLSLAPCADGIIVREFLDIACTPKSRHVAQHFVASLVQAVCALTGHRGPVFSSLELTPDPDFGLDHLQPWFGARLIAADNRALTIRIPDIVLDRLYPRGRRDRFATDAPDGWSSLRGDGSFAASVRILIDAELGERVPDAASVARAAGIGLRTLQRQLAAEGTSFTRQLDDVRRTRALARLSGPDATIGEISATLGYSGQSGLTRAVRRWTGAPPSAVRRSHGD
ncbi:MAG: helix-turn-helix domain-containing protein [Amaricoccus sp.]